MLDGLRFFGAVVGGVYGILILAAVLSGGRITIEINHPFQKRRRE